MPLRGTRGTAQAEGDQKTAHLKTLVPADPSGRLTELLSRPYPYRSWEDLYREEWTWDTVAHVTHTRVNCNSACSFVAYVKDGIVLREEQSAISVQTTSETPDFNPGGCTMGVAYAAQMYDPTRVKYPMKRVGERGSGRWERLSWDRALSEIADRIIDVLETDGPDCIVKDGSNETDTGIAGPIENHLFSQGLGAISIDTMSSVGDLPTGIVQSWGLYMSEGTADDWFSSDYIIVWFANPSYTHMPEAHFLWEARYRGAKVISISPDYNASTIHADQWLNVRSGTDTALAMAMIHEIIEGELFDRAYVAVQTDLPFLVREDNRRFLRESDVEDDGSPDVFYLWNTRNNRKTKAPGSWGSKRQTLKLQDDIEPALEGAHRVRLRDGSRVTVRPVFERLRERAAQYPADYVASITGIAAHNIRRVAREFAAAGSAMILASWGSSKQYYSDLLQRALTYLCALTNNSGGRPGTGIRVGALWPSPAAVLTSSTNAASPQPRTRPSSQGPASLSVDPPPIKPAGRISVQAVSKLMYDYGRRGTVMPLIPWLYAHDPAWREVASRPEYGEQNQKRSLADTMHHVFGNQWQPLLPKPPKRPRFFFFSGSNPLRRYPNPKVISQSLWQSFDTIVGVDIRMSTSILQADYVLPACGYYEKPGIKYTMSYSPYVVVGERAVEPLYESKHEWDIVLLLAEKIQQRAKERNLAPYTDPLGVHHDLSKLYDEMSVDGTYTAGHDGEALALNYILKYSDITRASDLGDQAWNTAVAKGAVRIAAIPASSLSFGIFSDYTPDRPISPCDWFINHNMPWPTLTGRQQFYIDHEWFLEASEELAIFKPPTQAGGDLPIRLTGGHSRWSMHSIGRANSELLRLQRGEPVAYIAERDAISRGVSDHDMIRIFNDVGTFELRAKVSATVQPGTVIVYNAWEGFQFPDRATQNDVTASPLKPNNMVGNYGQLHYRQGYYSMNHIPKEVAVDFERVRVGR